MMYDKTPAVVVSSDPSDCLVGWAAIGARLRAGTGPATLVSVECYPGVDLREVESALAPALQPKAVVRAEEAYRDSAELERDLCQYLTDDPVFGRMNGIEVKDFFDPRRLEEARERIRLVRDGVILVIGTGASVIAPWDVLVYANLARWTIQQRQRTGKVGNLGVENCRERPTLKYKRAFFVDWRAADRLKQTLYDQIDFLLDTNDEQNPKLISGDTFRRGLAIAASRPFRVVPFFDPGPWGGMWMMNQFDLPRDQPNYAWCFDCVPEENSLLLGFGDRRVEVPAIDLVFRHPLELLGDRIYRWLGAEFPIRFDFLDTMNGGNLSLQVHPVEQYIQENFGIPYTQHESYYMMEAAEDAVVYLGLKQAIEPKAMASDLHKAQSNGARFPAERYVNAWPCRKHDHFLIPGGTVHCSGRNGVVLEISATPYIFTFKLWDWGRLGLDGRPRPVHLDHGLANICWDRDTDWVRKELINRVVPLAAGEGWREERTGLHELEFIETRRHWFTAPVPHDTAGTVNVLNLVEGDEVIVESPTGAFDPMAVHYAETFIVPASVGPYSLRPSSPGRRECATIKASVRENIL